MVTLPQPKLQRRDPDDFKTQPEILPLGDRVVISNQLKAFREELDQLRADHNTQQTHIDQMVAPLSRRWLVAAYVSAGCAVICIAVLLLVLQNRSELLTLIQTMKTR